MAKLALSRTKSLTKLRQHQSDLKDVLVPASDLPGNRLFESGGPLADDSNRVAKLPGFVTRGGYDQSSAFENQTRPRTANEAMDRRKELMATGSPISVTSGRDIFNFPTPVRRPYTPQPDAHSETLDIGIALGSPSHVVHFQSPMFSSSFPNRLVVPNHDILTPLSTPGRSMTSYESRSTKNDMMDGERPKLSRWRSLGGLFGRRQASTNRERQSPLLLQTSPAPVDLKLQEYHTWEGENPSKVVFDQSPPLPPKKAKRSMRFGLARSQTAPIGRRGASPQPPPKGPMLDVDIPDTRMERYSVMFNQVLPSQQPSLLARRQASTAKRVDSLQALDIPPPKRRFTTTPEPSPSYKLLIFPPESTHSPRRNKLPHVSTLHRPRPLRRSNTAPGALSPGLKEKQAEAEKLAPLSSMSEIAEDLLEDNRQALTPTPSEPSTPTTPTDGQSVHSYNNFGNDRSRDTWDPALTEPSWEMITIGKVAEPGDRFSDAAKFAAGKVRVRRDSDEDREQEDWHHDGEGDGVVQIARSMSVTKARRQIVGSASKRLELEGQPKVVGPKRLEIVRKDGRTERFVERKALTPTLVQMVEMPGSKRKSVRVMIEDA